MTTLAALNIGAVMVVACSDSESTKSQIRQIQPTTTAVDSPAPVDSALWLTPQSNPVLEAGRQVWRSTCIDCHSTGLGGAPLIGNRDLWRGRLDQGVDVLFEHAKNGFYGDFGEMPARGGNESLTDEEIESAVRFMASQSGLVGS